MANNLTAVADFASLCPVCTFAAVDDRFSCDQLHLCNEEREIYLCGCLLNTAELLQKQGCESLAQLIPILYDKYNCELSKHLKGSYTLLVFDKAAQKIFATNDLLSKKSLYHYHDDKFFALSNSFEALSCELVKRGVALETDPTAAAMMMCEGFLWDDVTWAKSIQYLRPFEYLSVGVSGFSVRQLECGFANSSIAYEKAIERFDQLFKNAVTLQFKKSESEGFRQLASLSAGMDSRSTVLCADRLGYRDITCFTYAQSGSVDDTISKKIAFDYSFDHVFYSLDSAKFLLEVESAFVLNGGEQSYCGATGALSISKLLDGKSYGIIHTGLLGGEVMGDVQKSVHAAPVIDEISKTNIAIALGQSEIETSYGKIMAKYSCQQQLALQKHLRGCQNFCRMTSEKFQTFSPFMDEDVYIFLASLPTEYKQERKLYVDWMNRCLPNDYITTYMYGKPRSNELLRKAKYALRIAMGKVFGKSKYDMNPFAYWAKTNPQLVTKLQGKLCDIVDSEHIRQLPAAKFLRAQGADTSNLDLLTKSITVAKALEMIERLGRTGAL